MNAIRSVIDRLPFRWLLGIAIAYTIALVVGTHLPADVPPPAIFDYDKIIHFLAYFGLGVLWICVMHRWAVNPRYVGRRLVLAGVPWIIADELLQIPVGRHCDVFDMLADLLGLGCAWLVCRGIFGEHSV